MTNVFAWVTTNWLEAIGFVSGIASVWLFARQHVLAWPVGMITSLAWLVLFFQSALYADSALQVVYAGIGLWGWWQWVARGPGRETALGVTRMTRNAAWIAAVVALAGIGVLTLLLDRATDSTTPLPDAATTVLSLLATYLLGRKHVETWPVWIFGVNLPYIGLYLYKGLVLTAVLQPVFIALSIRGWLNWRRDLRDAA